MPWTTPVCWNRRSAIWSSSCALQSNSLMPSASHVSGQHTAVLRHTSHEQPHTRNSESTLQPQQYASDTAQRQTHSAQQLTHSCWMPGQPAGLTTILPQTWRPPTVRTARVRGGPGFPHKQPTDYIGDAYGMTLLYTSLNSLMCFTMLLHVAIWSSDAGGECTSPLSRMWPPLPALPARIGPPTSTKVGANTCSKLHSFRRRESAAARCRRPIVSWHRPTQQVCPGTKGCGKGEGSVEEDGGITLQTTPRHDVEVPCIVDTTQLTTCVSPLASSRPAKIAADRPAAKKFASHLGRILGHVAQSLTLQRAQRFDMMLRYAAQSAWHHGLPAMI